MKLAAALLALGGCWATPDRPTCALAHELGEINTSVAEGTPWLSRDRLELLFYRTDTVDNSRNRLFHAERATPADPFGSVVELAPPPQEADTDPKNSDQFDPWLAPDKSVLRFVSGSGDDGGRIYEAPRDDAMPGRYDMSKAKQVFVNFGTSMLRPTFTDDDLEMIYAQPTGTTDYGDLWLGRRDSVGEAFHLPPIKLAASTPRGEGAPMVSGDGSLIAYHSSDTTMPLGRIYISHRSGDDFPPGELVPELVDLPDEDDEAPWLAPDGKSWVFMRHQAGGDNDIWTYCE